MRTALVLALTLIVLLLDICYFMLLTEYRHIWGVAEHLLFLFPNLVSIWLLWLEFKQK